MTPNNYGDTTIVGLYLKRKTDPQFYQVVKILKRIIPTPTF